MKDHSKKVKEALRDLKTASVQQLQDALKLEKEDVLRALEILSVRKTDGKYSLK